MMIFFSKNTQFLLKLVFRYWIWYSMYDNDKYKSFIAGTWGRMPTVQCHTMWHTHSTIEFNLLFKQNHLFSWLWRLLLHQIAIITYSWLVCSHLCWQCSQRLLRYYLLESSQSVLNFRLLLSCHDFPFSGTKTRRFQLFLIGDVTVRLLDRKHLIDGVISCLNKKHLLMPLFKLHTSKKQLMTS